MKPKSARYHRALFVTAIAVLISAFASGQNSKPSGSPVFVINSKAASNLIYIPNLDKYYQFKIYSKKKSDTDYQLITTINYSEINSNKNPYSLSWTDMEESSTAIDYKVEAYNRLGSKICDMLVIWQCHK